MDKILYYASKVQNNRYLKAISGGLMATLPLTFIGSIALLLSSLPVTFWQNIVSGSGFSKYLILAYDLTVGIIALYATFFIGYQLSSELGHDKTTAVPAGIVSIFSFLMMTPLVAINKTTSTLDMSKLGAKGLFTAMIVGLVFSRLYVLFIDKKLVIHMPDGVPPFVSNSFASVVPMILTGVIAIVTSRLFGLTTAGSFSDFIYSILSAPLQHLTSSIWSLLFIVALQMIFWFFGVHGSLIVSAFITALYLPMDVQNMDAVSRGVSNSHLPNILGYMFYNLFAGIGGAGGTFSLIIVILIFAKSKQLRAVAGLGAIPGLFTINEPVVFGLPLILNPIMAIPFILTPFIQILIGYFGILLGIAPHLSGIQLPFGLPIVLGGFLEGGWRVALLQIIAIAVGCLIYFPFVKVFDKQKLAEEATGSASIE